MKTTFTVRFHNLFRPSDVLSYIIVDTRRKCIRIRFNAFPFYRVPAVLLPIEYQINLTIIVTKIEIGIRKLSFIRSRPFFLYRSAFCYVYIYITCCTVIMLFYYAHILYFIITRSVHFLSVINIHYVTFKRVTLFRASLSFEIIKHIIYHLE